jgi:hypothetical protein
MYCCSYALVKTYGTCSVISLAECYVLLLCYFPKYMCSITDYYYKENLSLFSRFNDDNFVSHDLNIWLCRDMSKCRAQFAGFSVSCLRFSCCCQETESEEMFI